MAATEVLFLLDGQGLPLDHAELSVGYENLYDEIQGGLMNVQNNIRHAFSRYNSLNISQALSKRLADGRFSILLNASQGLAGPIRWTPRITATTSSAIASSAPLCKARWVRCRTIPAIDTRTYKSDSTPTIVSTKSTP